ncbi:hypothetical protein, partial [Escherichia coli]|uniref:hypothetical protein n=1 Tax=Escherichia coli TaxID=562 RepID=UPI00234E14F1
DRNRSHWSTSKTPSYTKSVSWQHHPIPACAGRTIEKMSKDNNPFILMPLKLKGRHGIAAMFITWRNLQFYLLILRHTHNQRR